MNVLRLLRPLLAAVLLSVCSMRVDAEHIRTQGRFFDRAADYPIAVAYMYDGCRHKQADSCPQRKPVYHKNKKIFLNVSAYNEFRQANIHFMTIDTSRYRVKHIKDFLLLEHPDSFIVFIDGIVVDYDYLTGCPSEKELIDYIKNAAGKALQACQNGSCRLKKECYNGCNALHRDPLARQSLYAAGYYGGMGGEPPLGYGRATSGYSFSMGFRRLPN